MSFSDTDQEDLTGRLMKLSLRGNDTIKINNSKELIDYIIEKKVVVDFKGDFKEGDLIVVGEGYHQEAIAKFLGPLDDVANNKPIRDKIRNYIPSNDVKVGKAEWYKMSNEEELSIEYSRQGNQGLLESDKYKNERDYVKKIWDEQDKKFWIINLDGRELKPENILLYVRENRVSNKEAIQNGDKIAVISSNKNPICYYLATYNQIDELEIEYDLRNFSFELLKVEGLKLNTGQLESATILQINRDDYRNIEKYAFYTLDADYQDVWFMVKGNVRHPPKYKKFKNSNVTQKDTHLSMVSHSPLNQILYGPPGTGKTYTSIREAVRCALNGPLNDEKAYPEEFRRLREEGRIEFITFHQNYTYEDFITGLRPRVDGGALAFEQHDGIFKELVERARDDWEASEEQDSSTSSNYVIVIDEINRANISRVFGELITLIEDDKRLGGENALQVKLPDGTDDFAIPPNLYIIGTMNTVDKSIAHLDIALRRRFDLVKYSPDLDLIDDEAHRNLLQVLNHKILEKKGSDDFLIGHAYFMKDDPTEAILQKKVIPLLMEYFGGKTDMVSSLFEGTGWKLEYSTEQKPFEWDIQKS